MSATKVAYTVAELAELARVSVGSMRSRIKRRRVPSIKYKRKVYVAREYAHLAVGEHPFLFDTRPVILSIASSMEIEAPDYQIQKCTTAFEGGWRLYGLEPEFIILGDDRYSVNAKVLAPAAKIIVDGESRHKWAFSAVGAGSVHIDRGGLITFGAAADCREHHSDDNENKHKVTDYLASLPEQFNQNHLQATLKKAE